MIKVMIAAGAALWATLAPGFVRGETGRTFASGPNRALLQSGFVAVGVPYAASAVIAATSDHPGDKNLLIPVAGPWLDLGNRGGCGDPQETSCDRETVYKALLAVNGVVQGIGALEIIAAFIYPEARTMTVARASGTSWAFAPARLAGGAYGISAWARF